MENDNIKQAFSKVKEDMIYLNNEINSLKQEISKIKSILSSLEHEIKDPTHKQTLQQTNQHINSTYPNTPTHNPTLPQEVEGLKTPKTSFSTGNEGVPTNRQTDRQTNQQTPFIEQNIEQNLKKANEIFDSLDYLKKEIRQKFKRLTPQEMVVFSSIYQLEENDPENTTYKQIANNLKLSESSIRDYVIKIIDKGIPIKKQKIDNKKVILSISPDLKKIATLSTIIHLREL